MSTVINATGPVPQAVTVGRNVMEAVAGAIAGPGRRRTAQLATGVATAAVPAPVTVALTGAGLMNAACRRLP